MDFGSQRDVLVNNYWPRVGDPEVPDLGSALTATCVCKSKVDSTPVAFLQKQTYQRNLFRSLYELRGIAKAQQSIG